MKLIVLTNNENSKDLIKWLEKDNVVYVIREKINVEIVQDIHPDFIISYNYSHIIKRDVLEAADYHVINLHISYLPWNRGSSPNFWSFMEDTPKGVSIHMVDEGLDTGDILVQKQIDFSEDDSFTNTYECLNEEIKELFYQYWIDISMGKIQAFKQGEKYTYHTMKDLNEVREKIQFSWSDKISDVKKKYKMEYVDSKEC